MMRNTMPQIAAEGKTIEVPIGTNLREALLDNNIDLYNGTSKLLNCHGHSSCGACLVFVEGEVSQLDTFESLRMAIPPHSGHKDRRLACQVKVLGDVRVTKFDGHFGDGKHPLWTPEQKPVEASTASSS
jgi:ferredoxin